MQIIPVLDIQQGVVVRGVAGQRESYKPLCSQLVEGCDPVVVANAIRRTFGLNRLYVADLDAIERSQPNRTILSELCAADFTLIVDTGLRDERSLDWLQELPQTSIIAALETLPSPEQLELIASRVGQERIVFSLDLKDGQPLGTEAWPAYPAQVASVAVECGVRRTVVLDLAAVGVGEGIPTLPLCRQLRGQFSELITGGGVRCVDDLRVANEESVDGLLVASALHDGRIVAADL